MVALALAALPVCFAAVHLFSSPEQRRDAPHRAGLSEHNVISALCWTACAIVANEIMRREPGLLAGPFATLEFGNRAGFHSFEQFAVWVGIFFLLLVLTLLLSLRLVSVWTSLRSALSLGAAALVSAAIAFCWRGGIDASVAAEYSRMPTTVTCCLAAVWGGTALLLCPGVRAKLLTLALSSRTRPRKQQVLPWLMRLFGRSSRRELIVHFALVTSGAFGTAAVAAVCQGDSKQLAALKTPFWVASMGAVVLSIGTVLDSIHPDAVADIWGVLVTSLPLGTALILGLLTTSDELAVLQERMPGVLNATCALTFGTGMVTATLARPRRWKGNLIACEAGGILICSIILMSRLHASSGQMCTTFLGYLAPLLVGFLGIELAASLAVK